MHARRPGSHPCFPCRRKDPLAPSASQIDVPLLTPSQHPNGIFAGVTNSRPGSSNPHFQLSSLGAGHQTTAAIRIDRSIARLPIGFGRPATPPASSPRRPAPGGRDRASAMKDARDTCRGRVVGRAVDADAGQQAGAIALRMSLASISAFLSVATASRLVK